LFISWYFENWAFYALNEGKDQSSKPIHFQNII
jgi:hypothetical protein